ncbi:hypothetical protein SO694_00084041 [Aureococcus anophagefferens]|uniref:t-SNARE coiled-coil homology domain-containing protein n=1 Tax=Aureococcus anophagefferens TaxID=44056 RepID=A0ABR1G4A7_AURAN|nr:hypothetical protein JL722_6890 [Aureococcus anophagefferens]KAH8072844.1 hypothetical protein JL721_3494 [Aureococcus anophagefferens]
MAEGRRSLQDFEAEQDEALGELSDAVGRLHAMGLNINEELESQNALLDDVEASIDEVDDGLRMLTRKTEELVRKAGGKRWCALLTGLSITAVVLFYLVVFF